MDGEPEETAAICRPDLSASKDGAAPAGIAGAVPTIREWKGACSERARSDTVRRGIDDAHARGGLMGVHRESCHP